MDLKNLTLLCKKNESQNIVLPEIVFYINSRLLTFSYSRSVLVYHNQQGKLIFKNVMKNSITGDGQINIIDFYRDLAMDLYGKKGDNIHLYISEGHISLVSNAVFDINFVDEGKISDVTKASIGTLKSFSFYLDSKSGFLSKFALDMKKEYEKEKTKKLIKIPKVTAKFIVPPGIPVWITFRVDIYGRIYLHASAKMHADWGFENNDSLKIGGTYNRETNSFTPISKFTPVSKIYPLNIEGELNDSARVEIYPRADIKFYGVIGPYAEIVPFGDNVYKAKLQSQFTSNGLQNFLAWNSKIDVGLDFRTGIALNVFGLYKKDFGPAVINCFYKPLWYTPARLTLVSDIPESINKDTTLTLTYKVTDNLNLPVPACPVYLDGNGTFDHQILFTNTDGLVNANWTITSKQNDTCKATIFNVNKNIIDQTSSIITKGNTPPIATFAISPTTGDTTTLFTFDASGCTDNEDATSTLRVRWDFDDDGSWDTQWDTTKTQTHKFNTAGTHTVKLEVKDTEGLTDSIMHTITVNKSIITGTFTDSRDDQKYKTVTIGNQTWFAENLKYLPSVSPSSNGSSDNPYYYVYDYQGTNVSEAKAITNYKTYGVLYNWQAARKACPSGWHLPSDDEWKTLEMYLGMSRSEADQYGGRGESKKLKSTRGWYNNGNGTDAVGFSALPGGCRDGSGHFGNLGYYGFWWSATAIGSTGAWDRSLGFNSVKVYRNGYYKDYGFSVRCLRDH